MCPVTTAIGQIPESMGERIRWARTQARLSQERFAERVGTSRRHVMRWERGDHMPGPEFRARIAEVTDQPLSLFADDDTEEDA